jgi:hypothetical protein
VPSQSQRWGPNGQMGTTGLEEDNNYRTRGLEGLTTEEQEAPKRATTKDLSKGHRQILVKICPSEETYCVLSRSSCLLQLPFKGSCSGVVASYGACSCH